MGVGVVSPLPFFFMQLYALSPFDVTSNTFCPLRSYSWASIASSLLVNGTSLHPERHVHLPCSFGKHLNLNLLMMARTIELPLAIRAESKTGSVEDILLLSMHSSSKNMICHNTLGFNGFSLCLRVTYVLRCLDTRRFRVNKRIREFRIFNGGTCHHLYTTFLCSHRATRRMSRRTCSNASHV